MVNEEEIKLIAKKYGILPNSLLGQHFLIDNYYLDIISRDVLRDSIVIEIGPGLGQLTKVLSHKARKVIVIEIDNKFFLPLKQIFKDSKNVEIIIGDALSSILDTIISKESKLNNNIEIISNIPYHITEPLITKLAFLNIKCILMVGKTFAYQAQISNPNEKDFSGLSYICSSFFNVKRIVDVPRESFWPIPRTDSAILEFNPRKIKMPEHLSFYLGQNLILKQKHGGLIKNVLIEIFIELGKTIINQNLTKNQARVIVSNLNIPSELINKPFSQLNNKEIKTLATLLEKAKM